MEQISFVIPFGDTTDPKEVAKKMAKEVQLRQWYFKKEERGNDEGVAATTFTLMGWTTEW